MFKFGSKYYKQLLLFGILLFVIGAFIVGCSSARKAANKISGNDPIPEDIAKPVSVPIDSQPANTNNPRLSNPRGPVYANPAYVSSSNVVVKQGVPHSSSALNYSEALNRLAGKFTSAFPVVEGSVVSVKGKDVFIDLKFTDNITDGTKMTVFREGEEFRHPLSGEVLGRFEEEVGRIEVIKVFEKYSKTRVVSEIRDKKIRTGDKVRITSLRIKAAVLPFINKSKEDLDTDILTEEMVTALKATQRFDVYDKDKFQVSLLEAGIDFKSFDISRDLNRVKPLAKADYLLVNSIRDLKGKQVIDSEVYSLKDGTTILATNAIVKELPTRMASPRGMPMGIPMATYNPRVTPGGQQTSPVNPQFVLQQPGGRFFQQEGIWKSRIFNREIRNIAIGDVNGDGLKEVIIIFQNQILIFQSQGSKLERLYSVKGNKTDEFISLDVADINKNGVDEIYVSSIRGNFLNSFVIENKNGRYRKIAEKVHLFMRVLKPYNKEPFLIGQSMGQSSFFSNYIYKYTWNGKKLKRGEELGLPVHVVKSIYGFILDDINRDGKEDILKIDDEDHLRLYTRKGELKWVSGEYYGGYSLSFQEPTEGAVNWDISKGRDPIGTEAMVHIKGRILVYDTDRDGIGEIILQRNIPTTYKALKDLTGYNDSQMVNLVWDTAGLQEVWRAKNANGMINDFYIGDIDNDGMDELVAVLAFSKGSLNLKEKESMIIVYDMNS